MRELKLSGYNKSRRGLGFRFIVIRKSTCSLYTHILVTLTKFLNSNRAGLEKRLVPMVLLTDA